jgi:hypothetical protein
MRGLGVGTIEVFFKFWRTHTFRVEPRESLPCDRKLQIIGLLCMGLLGYSYQYTRAFVPPPPPYTRPTSTSRTTPDNWPGSSRHHAMLLPDYCITPSNVENGALMVATTIAVPLVIAFKSAPKLEWELDLRPSTVRLVVVYWLCLWLIYTLPLAHWSHRQ